MKRDSNTHTHTHKKRAAYQEEKKIWHIKSYSDSQTDLLYYCLKANEDKLRK